jgi:hypothetical protein
MDIVDFSHDIFGKVKDPNPSSDTAAHTIAVKDSSASNAHTISGTVVSDSADGEVSVIVDGYVVTADEGDDDGTENTEYQYPVDTTLPTGSYNDNAITLKTTPSAKAGDKVQITVVGADCSERDMFVTGNPGEGDRTLSLVQSKSTNYTSKPTTPYYAGDTWTDLANNVVYTCTTARTSSEEFNTSDWVVTGKAGKDTAYVTMVSSNGEVFKNKDIQTELSIVIFYGDISISNQTDLSSNLSDTLYLQWYTKNGSSSDFVTVAKTDSRLSNDGFIFAVSPDDVDTRCVFRCSLTDGTKVYGTGQVTITDVTDGINVHLSADSVALKGTMFAAEAGNVTTTVSALCGTNDVKATVDISKISGLPIGVTASKTETDQTTILHFAVTENFVTPTSISIPVYIPSKDITVIKKFYLGIAFAGIDSVSLKIISTNGDIFKESSIKTTLFAHVYSGGKELTADEIAKLGTIEWYVNGSTTPSYTGQSIVITSGSLVNTSSFMAVLTGGE